MSNELFDARLEKMLRMQELSLKSQQDEKRANDEFKMTTTYRLDTVENKLQSLPGNSRMQEAINRRGKEHVTSLLGYGTPDYERNYRKYIARLWNDFRQVFGVTTYKDLPAGLHEQAIAWIDTWKPISIAA